MARDRTTEDWRDDYARRVYAKYERAQPWWPGFEPAPARDLDSPSPDPDRELNRIRNL